MVDYKKYFPLTNGFITMDIRELEKITTDLKKGSDAGISKQHNSGKLTARERISRLVDSESFSELGMFVKH